MPDGNNTIKMDSIFHYTDERNVQIVIALLKAHGIRRVIASPGTTNMTFVVSVQNDPWFQLWSSVDERSAAYLACGLASETGEAVVLSCTGATASRNYIPALTEALYWSSGTSPAEDIVMNSFGTSGFMYGIYA